MGCVEALIAVLVMGFRVFAQDFWRLFDGVVAILTVCCGIFFLCRRAANTGSDVVEDIDIPILALRFALQPVRMITTATMVVRAHLLHKNAISTQVEVCPLMDPRRFVPEMKSILSANLASELQSRLPAYLRFLEWELAYSPRLHGTSLRTFYRHQIGPNIIVMRDTGGGLFGGFAPEAWRPQRGTYGFGGESFVFALRPEESSASKETLESPLTADSTADVSTQPPSEKSALELYWGAAVMGEVLQWSDNTMLGLGRAIAVCEDFRHGSSHGCETFCSKPLSTGNPDFIISDFECWHVGM